MFYLSGHISRSMRDVLEAGQLGLLQTPRTRYRLEGVGVWAMDNGCYTDTYPGDDAYMATLSKAEAHKDRCLFVCVPDVVGQANATLERFGPMAARISAAGWPVALVAQDGMTVDDLPKGLPWLFIGGSTEFKLGPDAEALIRAAQAQGTKVHVGRVNSRKRFRKFAELGCDTADGTFIAFAPDQHLPKVLSWMADPVEMRLI